MCSSGFFCQAEDGIRDLVRSRGLGDVYKRQAEKVATKDYFGNISASFVEGGTTGFFGFVGIPFDLSLIHI